MLVQYSLMEINDLLTYLEIPEIPEAGMGAEPDFTLGHFLRKRLYTELFPVEGEPKVTKERYTRLHEFMQSHFPEAYETLFVSSLEDLPLRINDELCGPYAQWRLKNGK